jgi:hypothetical protein
MIPYLLVGAALLLLFSPWMLKAGASILVAQPGKPAAPTYQSAIGDLARVRARLLQTRQLGDDQRAAIDTLTLALVAGSDQP